MRRKLVNEFALIGLGIGAISLQQPASAVVVNVRGDDYDVHVIDTIADDDANLFEKPPWGSMPWWGDEFLAQVFNKRVRDSFDIEQHIGPLTIGPLFAWDAGLVGSGHHTYIGVYSEAFCYAGCQTYHYSFGPYSPVGPPRSDVFPYYWAVASRIVPDAAPGPLPLFGMVAAFGYSRKLRKRIKDSTADMS